jgi:precorrin-6B methylase 1
VADAPGRLVVVGTGIQTVGHLTNESRAWIESADVIFYLAADPVVAEVIDRISRSPALDLATSYRPDRSRREIYDEIVERIIAPLADGKLACAALYGHPGVLSTIGHEAVAAARAAGYRSHMCAGISAEDCLLADLGIDPGRFGLISYEATDFVINQRTVDPSANLVLWQIGKVAVFDHGDRRSSPEALQAVVDKLLVHHPADHEVVVYQAAVTPNRPPLVVRSPLRDLPGQRLGPGHTLFVPPSSRVLADEAYQHFRR